MFTCEKCTKNFKKNYLLIRHKNKKNPCNNVNNINNIHINKIKNIENEINVKTLGSLETENICLFCNLEFTLKGNLNKHIKQYCKIKKELLQLVDNIKKEQILMINKQQLDLRDNEINILKEENKELKKSIKIIEPNNTPQNITINNPTINTINQNNLVVINPFGKEDLSHITLKDYKKYLNGFFRGFVDFIEKVHFDDNSNNKNICITNFKSKNLSVHDGNKWITQDKNEVIGKLINNKYNILNDKYEEFEESNKINEETINNFKEFRINYDNNESKKYAKNKIISMIYDNKDKIKDRGKINKKTETDTEEENSDSEIDDKPKKKTNKKKIIVETYSDSD
jgi:hypothetical protein